MENNTNDPVENDNSSLEKPIQDVQSPLHPRYRWLDLYRGVYLIFFFIASLTWIFAADIRSVEFPIGPTWLNFGYQYADFYPRMITLVDLGSQLFMYILGISLTISFRSKQEKKGDWYAWISVINRMLVFFWIGEVMYGDFQYYHVNDIVLLSIWGIVTIIAAVLRNTKYKTGDFRLIIGVLWSFSSVVLWFFKLDSDFWTIFFGNGLAHFAMATLLSALSVYLIRKPDYRIIIPIGLMGVHFFLWEILGDWSVSVLTGTLIEFSFMVPFAIIGLSSVAITATCVWEWMNMDPNDITVGIKKRIIPLMSITFIGQFVIDFFQTMDSEGMNTSIVFLGIALSCAFSMLAKAIDSFYDSDLPILTSIGKNGLFLFVLQALLTLPYRLIWPDGGQEFRIMVSQWFEVSTTHALVNFMGILAFIIPIAILVVVAWLLNRLKIQIKI